MHAENLVINQCNQRKTSKNVGEHPPDLLGAVFLVALVIEAVDAVNLAGLVVASENGHSVFVADLEGQY